MTDLYASLAPPVDEWQRRTDPARPLVDGLTDPVWRLANLYDIYDKKRQRYTPFRPKPEQQIIIWDIHVRGIKNILIPKARQIGFSTLLALIAFDLVLWQSGAKVALVDKTKEDGQAKMQDIVRVAWDRLPPLVQRLFPNTVLNEASFGVRMGQMEHDGWSRFRVEKSGRGSALIFLWVSEWGTIQFEEPKRSLEIRTGGMQAAEGGIRVIETTWKGGEGGDVWPYVEMALSLPEDQKDPATDWYMRFFPWFLEPSYTIDRVSEIRPHIAEYLTSKEKEIGVTFTGGQTRWYDARERELGLFIKREYPTTLQECWEAPVEGAIYADLYSAALASGRVFERAYVDGVPVHTLWDLGSPDNTVVWYWQEVGGQIRFVDCDTCLWLTTPERVKLMKGKGYVYGKHYLPHDAGAMKTSVLTFRGELIAAGLDNTVVVPRTTDIHLGINRTRMLFPSFVFDPIKCAAGIKAVKQYHYHKDRHEPVADWAEHACDALKVLAEADAAGLLSLSVNTSPLETMRYFDPDALTVLESRVLSTSGAMMCGVVVNKVFTPTAYDECWVRVWQAPHNHQSYVIGVMARQHEREGDAVVVLRVVGNEYHSVAALADCGGVDIDVLAGWVAALADWYGGALVVPVMQGSSGLLEALQAVGCANIYAREVPREGRRVGQGKRLKKRGYELTPDAREHCLALLQTITREEQLHLTVEECVEQMSVFIQPTPDTPPKAAPGSGESWVLALAVALHAAPSASMLREQPAPPEVFHRHSAVEQAAFGGNAES